MYMAWFPINGQGVIFVIIVLSLLFVVQKDLSVVQAQEFRTPKLGSFEPVIPSSPSSSPVPTKTPTSQISKAPSSTSVTPTLYPLATTAASQKYARNWCPFKKTDFTEFYEFKGITYGLLPSPKKRPGGGDTYMSPGWYMIFIDEKTSIKSQVLLDSFKEFEENIPIGEKDQNFVYMTWDLLECEEWNFQAICAMRVATICTTNCFTPKVSPKPGPAFPKQETTGNLYDPTKLCIPLKINGSQADKMDTLIIPLNFSNSERTSGLTYTLAQRAVQKMNDTNLSQYPKEILNKMNWYMLNVGHPDFPLEELKQFEKTGLSESDYKQNALSFGRTANFCGRDRFMIIIKGQSESGFAVRGVGGVTFSSSIEGPYTTFVHEWGHAVGDLMDEYENTNETHIAANCSVSGNGIMVENSCPQWDCTKTQCSPLAKRLLGGLSCYPRCGKTNYFRPMKNSIMDNPYTPGGTVFSGPSLVHLIEKVFANYK